MKKSYRNLPITMLVILLAFSGSYQANAQRNQQRFRQQQMPPKNQPGARQENIEAQRIAFITQELALTPDEAKVFWPVYNEYDAKRIELRKTFRDNNNLSKIDIDKLSDKDATQILDNQIIEAQKLLDLRKEYHSKFKTVLPAVKVLKLYNTERDFQKMLIDKIRQNRQGPQTGRP